MELKEIYRLNRSIAKDCAMILETLDELAPVLERFIKTGEGLTEVLTMLKDIENLADTIQNASYLIKQAVKEVRRKVTLRIG